MPVALENPVKSSVPQTFAAARPPRQGDKPAVRAQPEYKLSEHPPEGGTGSGTASNPNAELTEALQKAASKNPEPPVRQQTDESDPPEVKSPPPRKFIAPDEPEAEAAAAAPESPETKPKNASQLREAYEALKTDFSKSAAEGDVTRKELAEFRAKAQDYEARLKALEPLQPRIKEYEDKLAQYDERLRIIDYVQHPEFHEEFVKPVSDALASAHSIVKEMQVNNPDGTSRPGNEQDFAAVLAAPNLTEANRVAKELFGPDLAPTAITHRTQVLTAERQRQEAVRTAALKSQEFAKTAAERQHAEVVKFRDTFKQAKDALAEKYAPVYKPDLSDKEIADTYQRGVEAVNAVMERDAAVPQEEFVQHLARVYHRAANAPVLLLKNQRLQRQIDELQDKLSKYEKSEPGAGAGGESNGNAEIKESEDPRTELRRRLEAVVNRKS